MGNGIATVTLGAVGNIIYPGLGGLIGGLAGAGIDLLVNLSRARRNQKALQPDDSPRLPDADEGAGAPWVLGSTIRVPGQLIFINIRNPVPVDGSTKGKTEGSQVDRYFADVGIAWCRNRTGPEPVRRIWASNELVYVGEGSTLVIESTSYTIAGDIVYKTVPKYLGSVQNIFCDLGTLDEDTMWRAWATEMALHIWVPVSSAEARGTRFLQEGALVTISGAANAANNGTFELLSVLEVGPDGQNIEFRLRIRTAYYEFNTPGAPCTPSAGGTFPPTENGGSITVSQVTADGTSRYFDVADSNHYSGDPDTDNLLPDPLMESVLGAGTVPAHRGTCYSVLSNMDISKWAGTIPRFEADIRELVFRNVKDVIDELIRRTETLSVFDYDTSALVLSPFVVGLLTVGPGKPIDLLQQVMTLYGVVAQQQVIYSGSSPVSVLVFSFRSDTQTVSVPYSETSARESGSQGDVHALISRGSRRDLPQEFVLDFISLDRDLQSGTTSYSVTTASVRNTQKMTVPIVFDANRADTKARELLWRAINEHDEFSCKLMPTMFALQAGDQLELTGTSANPIFGRVTEATVGENGILDVKGLIDDDLALIQGSGGDDPDPLVSRTLVSQYVDVYGLDMAPMTATDASLFGTYIYVTGGIGPLFPTVDLYVSQDRVSWTYARSAISPANAGSAVTILPDASAAFWDDSSTVEIRLWGDTVLFDDTEEQVTTGINWARLGSELVGFTTATLLSPGVYELSGLLRGRNDTDTATGTHFVGEPFVVVQPTGPQVLFTELPSTLYQVDTWVRPVPAGTTLADNVDRDTLLVPNAETLRPYRVHGARATRLLTEDLCLFVTDRTRVPYRIFSALVPPQVEVGDAEDYIAEVYWDSDPGVGVTLELLRELTGCRQADGEISFHYTRELQITDLHVSGRLTDGSFPNEYQFVVYRKSDTIGPGRRRTFCAVGYGWIPVSDCTPFEP